jgi:hypothetical protein
MWQDMDDMEESCIVYVKVGMFTHLEHCKISLLTVNKTGLVQITVKYDLIVTLSSMYDPGDRLRQTSAAFGSFQQ